MQDTRSRKWQLTINNPIFLNSGGNAKFKSDLPEGIKVKSKRKRVVMVACSLILCVISLVLLIALLISLLS